MANDRMALVCKECMVGVGLAKYHPGDPHGFLWRIPAFPERADQIEEFLRRHAHDKDHGQVSAKQFFLGYESDDLPWEYEHRKASSNG